MKVTEIDWYALHKTQYHDYLKTPETLPEVLKSVTNPEHKKFWFREGEKDQYRCFCFCHGQWWEYRTLQHGFYEFHVPTTLRSIENFREFERMRRTSPELFKALLPKVRKDVDFWFMKDHNHKSNRDASKGFLAFCKKNNIKRKNPRLPLPLP
jgi:hypothetical protein